MRLRKACPQCSTVIHARRSVCECGHAFTLKREARITASSPAKRKRALESFCKLILIIFKMRHCVIIFVPHLQTDSDRWLYLE